MELYLHMDKQEQEKHLQWRVCAPIRNCVELSPIHFSTSLIKSIYPPTLYVPLASSLSLFARFSLSATFFALFSKTKKLAIFGEGFVFGNIQRSDS
jgi:hypothetical protein